MFDKSKAKKAIREGDIDKLRQVLDAHPQLLEKQYRFGGSYSGYLLHMAAFNNKPDIIEFLVKEKKADVNRNDGVAAKWTPLHHAEKAKAYKAATKLLELGANPSVRNANNVGTTFFVDTARQQDPEYVQRARLRNQAAEAAVAKLAVRRRELEEAERLERVAGKWTLTAPAEVTHEYDMADGSHRLKDIFNFRTRIWRSVVTDLATNALAQNIVFFDAMPDATILQEPLQKLKELGGKADESALPASALPKKALKPATTP